MEDVTNPDQSPIIHFDEDQDKPMLDVGHLSDAPSTAIKEPHMPSSSDIESEDEFVNALEESPEKEMTERPSSRDIQMDDELVDALIDSDSVRGKKEETPDLFDRTFTCTQSAVESDDADDEEELPNIYRAKPKAKAMEVVDLTEHGKCCSGRSASTPPPSSQNSKKSKTKPQVDAKIQPPIDITKDLCREYRMHQRYHDRVKIMRPKTHLAFHRYWIGVVKLGKQLSNVKEESHFVWMRGNRFTTVRTVQEAYMINSMTPNVVLLYFKEKVSDRTRMEELDDFNDKMIFFRAMDARDPEAKGKAIGADWEPKPYPKETSKQKGPELSAATVIEIDSD